MSPLRPAPWRLLYRVPLFLLHLLVATPLTVLAQTPPGQRWRPGSRSVAEHALRAWSRGMCRLFGVRPVVRGRLPDRPHLVVANHLSWLDIQLMHGVGAMSFVAKAEIARWPLMGFLAKAGGTVFHQRGSHDSASGVLQLMQQRLAAGRHVAIFPEGGIRPGPGVKRFHARLFRAAVDSGCPVQPVMLRYLDRGGLDHDITFRPGENLVMNMLRLLARPPVIGEVRLLAPISARGQGRDVLARAAQQVIEQAYWEGQGTGPRDERGNHS